MRGVNQNNMHKQLSDPTDNNSRNIGTGWKCPDCKKIYAPFIPICFNCSQKIKKYLNEKDICPPTHQQILPSQPLD